MDVKMLENEDAPCLSFALVVQTKEQKLLNELRESLLQLTVTK